MRLQKIIYSLLGSALFLCSCAHIASPLPDNRPFTPNTVLFPPSFPAFVGKPLNLAGEINKPEGPGLFPAVVLLHGCGGMSRQRDNRWVEKLARLGYVTLQVDSFGPRGLTSVCTYTGSDALDILQRRITDAYDAKRYLAELPFVDRRSIVLMGWSHGGFTTLEALSENKEEPFRAAIAFYPSCRKTLANINAPLLILIGARDDWTPADRCLSAMQGEKTEPEVILKVYPEAYHGFDILGANHDVRGSRGMHHLQYQREADEDAFLQVRNFLARYTK